ncbi:MAG TPA: hypothetical protein VH025_04060, partial [Solirubrobacteraceae bacterium]|nr:hypothetical protein [Solirubrobacteraceae bacterium]
SSTLLERVNAMDGEVQALVQSLRAGAGRLAADLSAVESGMSDLYDSAAGRAETAQPAPPPRPPAQPAPAAFESQLETAIASEPPPPPAAPVAAAQPAAAEAEAGSSDIDGARLIALNMALNGESRADTERYLAENFQIPDRLKLIDEVYAAIEG